MTDEQKLRELLGDLADDREFQAAMLEEDLISRVALRVLKARKANGLTQAELAKMIGTHQPGIARIEAGESNLRLRTLAQLALALRCEPEALVSERAPRFLENPWKEEGRDLVLISHLDASAKGWDTSESLFDESATTQAA